MNKLRSLKKAFLTGKITKKNYIKKMFQIHQILFEYSAFITDTDIGKIEIEDNMITMTMRKSLIKFQTDINDLRSPELEMLNFAGYEKREMVMVLRLLKKDGVVFDIGANTGINTLQIKKYVQGSKVYAFEPIPQTFDSLKKNIALNHLSKVFAYNFGFSDKKATITFFYNAAGPGNASSTNLTSSKSTQKVLAKVITLDQFANKNNVRVDLIMCDVEGAELMVFKGGKKTIEKYKPIIYTEMLRKWAAKFNYNPNELILLLRELGYRCFELKKKKLAELLAMNENTISTNFFFLHKNKHRDLILKFS